ncbi:DUF305 domain-containing protein [Rhodohalobacter sp. 8-1]|uniref:DUF305 domain-containing protein n=1 Tax=Rhodohalobacter sp. 8-1 TaxID=3131972 RepID=UPI0030EC41E8
MTLQFDRSAFFTSLLLSIIFILALSGCSGTSAVTEQRKDIDSSDTENYDELEELYWSRIESDRMSFTEADVAFMTGMIGHHAQALIMSRLAPKNNASPEIQRLAARIINSQQDEIQSMQTWLERRDQPVPEVHINGLNLMIHGVNGHGSHDHTDMPGMLSDEQLQQLSDARGREFDRLFLSYMIAHHQGAVTMVDTLVSTDGAAQDEDAFRLSADINADQVTEIERMKLMLEEIQTAN